MQKKIIHKGKAGNSGIWVSKVLNHSPNVRGVN